MPIQHSVIPDAQLHETKGAAAASNGQILTANGDGTATFQTPTFTKAKVGWWDYNDTATTSTPIPITLAATEYQLTNNGLGANTNTSYGLASITDIWDTTSNIFDFIGLSVGDTVDLRIDIEVTTASTNNVITMSLELGVGGTPYKLPITEQYFKSTGVHKVVVAVPFYIGSLNVLNFPARLLISNDTVGSTVKVNGWFVRAITNV